MMQLYSGTTCPFSHRCRFVLYEKGMDFQVIDVDLYNKPEDIAVMNPYNRLPVLVERDLILYESNIINEYIDERFPHPQLMPADPVMRAGLSPESDFPSAAHNSAHAGFAQWQSSRLANGSSSVQCGELAPTISLTSFGMAA